MMLFSVNLDGEYPGGGFHMRVNHGTIPGCLNGKTRVVLRCDSTAEWISKNLTEIIQVETKNHCDVSSSRSSLFLSL